MLVESICKKLSKTLLHLVIYLHIGLLSFLVMPFSGFVIRTLGLYKEKFSTLQFFGRACVISLI